MSDRPVEILLVESDRELSEMLVRQLEDVLFCRVTIAESGSVALREDLTGQHDLILMSADLPDDEDFSLLRHLRVTNDCPCILIADRTETAKTVEALRQRAMGWFEKPFDLADFCDYVKTAAERELEKRREKARFNRLRRIARRIIREREDLNERMELLCKDLVQAYRRLAEKVTQTHVES
jgi:DNA-binding response OmpR family regulator